jgi:carbamoyl-phosphate synthase large subunit
MSKMTVGITGINAVDNPGPGVGVARSLKEDKQLDVKIFGFAYDPMEPGIYMDWLIDKSFILPYPSGDQTAYLERLYYIKKQHGLDFIISNLDAELPLFIKYQNELASYGIQTFLPTQEQFRLRGKDRLIDVAEKINIKFPASKVVTSYSELEKAVDEIGLPVMVKGAFYKADRAYTTQEAMGHYNSIVAEWGYPIILQKVVAGDEMNVVGVGDGEGNSLGLVAIKKMWITSAGKIWTGVTIKNEEMLLAANNFIQKYKWRGGFELECIVSEGNVHLIEINPRFPAWCFFATGVGINLPSNLIRKAMDLPLREDTDYPAGKLYVRYTYELITDMGPFQSISTKGEK